MRNVMRINHISVNNFKSLVDFEIELPKFACLIGLNGAGKSTFLQFVDFLGQQVRGDLKVWLEERQWKPSDLNSKLLNKRVIEFCVSLDDDGSYWKGSYNPSLGHCTQEDVGTPDASLKVDNGRIKIVDNVGEKSLSEKISYSYEGSVLSQLRDSTLPFSLLRIKHYFAKINSLDLLSPEHLRKRNRTSSGSLGLGGENLSAFLHEMGKERRDELAERLKQVYPHISFLNVKSLKSGWKQLEVQEKYPGTYSTDSPYPEMITRARHINDGMLRLVAMMAAVSSENRFLLFDEIENGINPELVEFVLQQLVSALQQIVVTTHSPMILNYLEDEVAREGVVYLYKTKEGFTRSIKFFDIPSLSKKLDFMGPGEAFVDTDLIGLAEEINSMSEGS